MKTKIFIVLFLLAAAVLSFVVNGYHFGVYDQVAYIPMLEKVMNPALYPGDALFTVPHPTFLWQLIAPFVSTFGIEHVFLSLFLLTLLAYYASIYFLSYSLFRSHGAAVLAVIALIVFKPSFGPVMTADAVFTPRFLVRPLLLFAFALFLRKKYTSSFFLVGAAVNFHGLSAIGALIVLGSAVLLQVRTIGFKLFARCGGAALLGAAPFFLLLRGAGATIDFSLGWELLSFLKIVSPFFNDFLPRIWSQHPVFLFGFGAGLLEIFLCIFFAKRLRGLMLENVWQQLKPLFFGVVIACSIAGAATVLPVVFFVQLQLIRMGTYFVEGAFILLAAYGWHWFQKTYSFAPVRAVVVLAFFSILHMVPVFTYAQSRGMPHISSRSPHDAIYATSQWMRTETPMDARFIAPPHIGGWTESDFRTFSQRSIVISNFEMGAAQLKPGFEQSVRERMNDLTQGKFDEFLFHSTSYADFFRLAYEGYSQNTDADFRRIGKKYGAQYAIVERNHASLSFPVAYTNDRFLVYYIEGSL